MRKNREKQSPTVEKIAICGQDGRHECSYNSLWLQYGSFVESVAHNWFLRYRNFLSSRDDVLQEAVVAWLKAIVALDSDRSEIEIKQFLRKSIQNHLISVFLRKENGEVIDEIPEFVDPNDPEEWAYLEEKIMRATAGLSSRHLTALEHVIHGTKRAYKNNVAHYAWRLFSSRLRN